jgi:ribonuclease III
LPASTNINSSASPPNRITRQQIKTLTGFIPLRLHLFELAFQHSSLSNEITDSNERLEFLGDAVLGLVVANYLFKKFPYKDEGYLTELRSKMVSRSQLSQVAMKMGIDQLIQFNRADKSLSLHVLSGNALEALVGSVYTNFGYKKTERFIYNKIIKPYLDIDEVEKTGFNYKGKLLEWTQKNNKKLDYVVHNKRQFRGSFHFRIGVRIDEEELGIGEDFSKKNAEKKAAQIAFEKLGLNTKAE